MWWSWVPSNWAIAVHNCDVNWGPLSDDMSIGIPKRAIQWETRACAQLVAVVSPRGMASGQRENRSTNVRRWVKPLEGGSGPTRST